MEAIREFKRRRKAEKKVDQNVLAAALPSELDWWDHFSARITGPLSKSKNLNTFESVFKISRKTFDYICSIVNDTLKAKSNLTGSDRKPLSPTDQVAIALRRLSCGESLSNVGDSFGVNQSTVSHITWRFVEAMEEKGIHHLRWPSEMKDIKYEFEKIEGLPNCCGVIDTTHILMTLSTVDDSNNAWIDQEKNHSMVLQAIIDPNMRFLDVNIGYPGSLSDAHVLQSSNFFKLAEERERLNEKATKMREYIIGDEGFPLLPWLITPFQQTVHDYQVEFNKRHSATLTMAKSAFSKLKETWRIIHGNVWLPDKNKLPRIAFVCCLLHNIVIEMDDKVFDEMSVLHSDDKDYSQQICEYVSQAGADLREELSLHLSGELVKNKYPHGQAPNEVQLPELVTMASQKAEKRKQMDSLVSTDPPLIPEENMRYKGKTVSDIASELDGRYAKQYLTLKSEIVENTLTRKAKLLDEKRPSKDIIGPKDEKIQALIRTCNLKKSQINNAEKKLEHKVNGFFYQKRSRIQAKDENVQEPNRTCNPQQIRNAGKKPADKFEELLYHKRSCIQPKDEKFSSQDIIQLKKFSSK